MSSVSFTIPHAKLRAAALFASTDETRYAINGVRVEQPSNENILIIATDGRRMAIIRHLLAPRPKSAQAFPSFTIPTGLLDAAEHLPRKRRVTWDDEEEAPRAEPHDVTVAYDDATKLVTLCTEGRNSVSAPAVGESFPNWRSALPADAPNPAIRTATLDPELLRGVCKAAEIIDPNGYGCMQISAYGKASDAAWMPYCFAFRNSVNPDFFALLMPVRGAKDVAATVPDWLT